MSDLFFNAACNKFRFTDPSLNGTLCTEDLFGLHLQQLDRIAINLNRQVKEVEEESFIKPVSSDSSRLGQELEVVKAVIAYKLELKERAEQKAKLKAERDVLLKHAAELQQKELEQEFTKSEDVNKRIQELSSLINA
jgi:DNA repair exonuclease SbcCD ATPase subunit